MKNIQTKTNKKRQTTAAAKYKKYRYHHQYLQRLFCFISEKSFFQKRFSKHKKRKIQFFFAFSGEKRERGRVDEKRKESREKEEEKTHASLLSSFTFSIVSL